MAKPNKPLYKVGDVLLTKAGTPITIKLIFFCNGCKENHYQLYSKVRGTYSHPIPYFDKLEYITPPTPAGKVLFGHN